MSSKEKNALWIGGALVALLILYALMRKGGMTNINNSSSVAGSPASYTVQGMPAGQIWNGGVSGLPTLDMDTSDCGCTSVNGGNFYTSINDMIQSFNKASTNAFNSYQNNVYATTPSYISQYFNNPTGVGQSQTSQAILTNKSGSLPFGGGASDQSVTTGVY